MKKIFYKSDQRVILKANRRLGWKEQHGIFVGISGKSTVLVQVEPEDDLDDDGLREVAVSAIKPFYDHPTDRQRRAKNAARKFKMGVRVFRLDKPDGKRFCVSAIDLESGVAFGTFFKRKTIQEVSLHALWPDLR